MKKNLDKKFNVLYNTKIKKVYAMKMKAIGKTIEREKMSLAESILSSSICETHWSVWKKEENRII